MAEKSPLEKLRILLPHWIEHNHSHEAEFKKWAALIRQEGDGEVAGLLAKAISSMEETDKILSEALDKIGGPAESHHHHHHHGHDHD